MTSEAEEVGILERPAALITFFIWVHHGTAQVDVVTRDHETICLPATPSSVFTKAETFCFSPNIISQTFVVFLRYQIRFFRIIRMNSKVIQNYKITVFIC